MSTEFSQVPLSGLSIGTVLTAPIYDSGPRRSKLLGEQIEINEQFIKQLEARGVYSVSVSKRDLAAMEAGQPQGRLRKVSDHQYAASRLVTSRSRDIDDEIRCGEIRSSVEGSTDGPPIPAPSTRYDREAVTAEVARREQQVVYMDGLFQSLVRDDPSSADGLSDVCRSSIKAIVGDKDLFLALGLNPFSCDYPSRHSLHVCSVAIAIGVSLSLDDQSLIDLGTGCLVHDVGMLKLDRQIYKAKRDLSRRELIMLADHPVLTLDALACPGVSLSREARLVAYQIHERCDGSGYPRGTRADEIHQLSKIAAVADAYVGLVSNRWHRSGLIPYFAIEKILKSIPQGLYDAKVVRALLNTISLFPIGSFIETNDGRVGRVVRATGGTYTKPVIELWNNRHRQFEPDLVDLSKDSSIWVHRAVSTPGYV